jgi:hypothetical protein
MTWMAELNEKKSRQFDEQRRHNKAIEETAMWKAKNDELEYKFNVIKRYREMRKMKLSKKLIVKQSPEMKDLVNENDNNSDSISDSDSDV